MTTTNTTTSSTRRPRRGQAAVETAICLMAFALAAAAIFQLGSALLVGFDQIRHARRDAGVAALTQSDGERMSGHASDLASLATPRTDTCLRPLPPDAWDFPIRTLPNAEQPMASLRDRNIPATELIPGSAVKRVDLNLTYMDVDLYPDGIRLSEHVYLPPMETP